MADEDGAGERVSVRGSADRRAPRSRLRPGDPARSTRAMTWRRSTRSWKRGAATRSSRSAGLPACCVATTCRPRVSMASGGSPDPTQSGARVSGAVRPASASPRDGGSRPIAFTRWFRARPRAGASSTRGAPQWNENLGVSRTTGRSPRCASGALSGSSFTRTWSSETTSETRHAYSRAPTASRASRLSCVSWMRTTSPSRSLKMKAQSSTVEAPLSPPRDSTVVQLPKPLHPPRSPATSRSHYPAGEARRLRRERYGSRPGERTGELREHCPPRRAPARRRWGRPHPSDSGSGRCPVTGWATCSCSARMRQLIAATASTSTSWSR
jgi:hypothetical protein